MVRAATGKGRQGHKGKGTWKVGRAVGVANARVMARAVNAGENVRARARSHASPTQRPTETVS